LTNWDKRVIIIFGGRLKTSPKICKIKCQFYIKKKGKNKMKKLLIVSVLIFLIAILLMGCTGSSFGDGPEGPKVIHGCPVIGTIRSIHIVVANNTNKIDLLVENVGPFPAWEHYIIDYDGGNYHTGERLLLCSGEYVIIGSVNE
jgi:hypothetical protein